MRQLISNSLLLPILIAMLAAWCLAQSPAPKKAAKPLSEAEVMEGLSGGISSKRLSALVGQYGVDFKLTPENEQRLRGVGADDSLLLAIHNAEPKAAQLVISVNGDCNVDINGNVFSMKAGEKRKVDATSGYNLIQATRVGESVIAWEKLVTIQSAEEKVVRIELPSIPANQPTTPPGSRAEATSPLPPAAPAIPQVPKIDAAEEAWAALRDCKDPVLLEKFMKQFPNSPWLLQRNSRLKHCGIEHRPQMRKTMRMIRLLCRGRGPTLLRG